MTLALIGYRGTGKSTVSAIIAKTLRRKLFSLDTEIEKFIGQSISQYKNKHTWKEFRIIENSVIKSIENKPDLIVDCGGGVVEDKRNIDILKKNNKIVLLTSDVETIKARIKDSKRPKLTDKDLSAEIEYTLLNRLNMYSKAADLTLDTSNKNPKTIANEIIRWYDGQ